MSFEKVSLVNYCMYAKYEASTSSISKIMAKLRLKFLSQTERHTFLKGNMIIRHAGIMMLLEFQKNR